MPLAAWLALLSLLAAIFVLGIQATKLSLVQELCELRGPQPHKDVSPATSVLPESSNFSANNSDRESIANTNSFDEMLNQSIEMKNVCTSVKNIEVCMPEDVESLWAFLQDPTIRKKEGCEPLNGDHPIEPEQFRREIPDYIEFATKRKMLLIVTALATNGNWDTVPSRMTINGQKLKDHVLYWCHPGQKDYGYQVVFNAYGSELNSSSATPN